MTFTHPTTPAGRKTPRIRGRIFQFVRTKLATGDVITWADLCPPLSRRQGDAALFKMRRLGEVVRVRTAGYRKVSISDVKTINRNP